ncbi:MAG: AAA domain-containing protein [Candidatus Moraniibacteriota bacterium]
MEKEKELSSFIKYCLGYVRMTRQRTALSQKKYSIELPANTFSLAGLLNGEEDGSLAELINLDTFYGYDPKDVPEDLKEVYEKEKALANKIDEIHSKYRNDPYTKQTILNFGYFEIEIPTESNGDVVVADDADEEPQAENLKTKIDRYPLFTLPIRIEADFDKEAKKYSVYFVDSEIQVNIGILEPILGEDLYFRLLEELGEYEMNGLLTLPISDLEVFREIWHKIKAQLRLKDANFDEESFSLEDVKISLSPKANYFLAEDLTKLAQLPEDALENTALTSWTQDEELNIESDIPHEQELFFPFLYDKYQLSTLSILNNKASIIQGPPGTGKSETISNILCHLAATGKRVLFVSQKAQALKVVKDKLNKLNVKYLYGYLPNPNSAQIGEEDEMDGIAPQLSALSSHIDRLGYKFNRRGRLIESNDAVLEQPNISKTVAQKEKYTKIFNSVIDIQRYIYKLHQELKQLVDYDIEITDSENFSREFSSEIWDGIKNMKQEAVRLSKIIEGYDGSDEKEYFDKLFSSLEVRGKEYAPVLEAIRDDMNASGFDGHSKIGRSLNNFYRNIRLGSVFSQLPREIRDYIDEELKKDISRNEAVKFLNFLHTHCAYHEAVERLQDLETDFRERLAGCGVSEEEFSLLENLIDTSSTDGLDDVKNKILRVQEIKSELLTLFKTESINRASSALKSIEQERKDRVALYIQNIVNKNILEKWKTGIMIKQIIQKFSRAFGKSKKAFKTFDNLRKDADNFNAVLDLIPIWIMELDDASRIIPLESGIFDYVILDEASQCNVAYTLPVMFRSSRAIFVGDSEQMRDSTIMFKSNRVFDELARRYQIPEEHQIKATGSAVQSVLDIAKNRGFMCRTLHYHYRSPMELIDFSNRYFYKPNGKDLIPLNNNYLTYKDTNRVLLLHHVQSDWSEEISDNVNVAEAKAILNLFKELRSDEHYQDKSIGILAFFNAQASYIRELFEEAGYKEEKENYKVSIVEGIQGDEKDIIIYSFVIRDPKQKNRYGALTGEGGDIRGDINKGRVNVAFSRARLQVHCFTSLLPHEMPTGIWLKKYLEYVEENGEVAFNSGDLKPFDSYFEEEFYHLLKAKLKRGYKIQNQVESCGFKIDFVASNLKTGKRLAIECDGPTHFKDEIDEEYGIYIESDEERQRVLEAAGWQFCRIKYADWINENFDRDAVVAYVEELLN